MATVGWSQTDIDTLRTALATGVLEVEYDGPPKRRVTYKSATEMLRILSLAMREVNGTTTHRTATTRKGV